jgi:hypothetical protein
LPSVPVLGRPRGEVGDRYEELRELMVFETVEEGVRTGAPVHLGILAAKDGLEDL